MRLIAGLILGLALSWAPLFAGELPFTDVTKDAPYYTALSNLYEQGIISPNSTNRFGPDELMNRDFYLSLAVGVGCYKCVNPSLEDILKYKVDPFIDVTKEDPYFYCISYGKEKEITKGYSPDASGYASCENRQKYASIAFCPANTISRIEAVALLLRRANLWDDRLNSSITRTLAIPDTTDYWYGYAKKGIDAGLISQKPDGTIGQDEKITKAEFVIMAGKILDINQCSVKNDTSNGFATAIEIIDPENKKELMPSISSTKPVNLVAYPENTDGSYTYSWTITNPSTGEVLTRSGQIVEKITIPQGVWIAKVTVADKTTGKTSTSVAQIVSQADTINTNPPSGTVQLGTIIDVTDSPSDPENTKNFISTISGGDGKYTYYWDFGDSTSATEANPTHTYKNPGNYTPTLTVTDGNGNTSKSKVTIEVGATNNPSNNIQAKIQVLNGKTGSPLGSRVTPDQRIRFVGLPDSNTGGTYTYSWTLTNNITGEKIIKSTQTIDDIKLSVGNWEVVLLVTDKTTGKTSTSVAHIMSQASTSDTTPPSGIIKTGNISTLIRARPLVGNIGDTIGFASLINGGNGKYTYNWIFGDGNQSTLSNPSNTYKKPGNYTVGLTVRDSDGNISTSQVVITISGDIDSDGDGIKDGLDLCPKIKGLIANEGCPPVKSTDHRDNILKILNGRNDFDPALFGYSSLYTGDGNACIGRAGSSEGLMIGSSACTSCPCSTSISILSDFRKCDIIFPTILSPDKKDIYSRGKLYQIQ